MKLSVPSLQTNLFTAPAGTILPIPPSESGQLYVLVNPSRFCQNTAKTRVIVSLAFMGEPKDDVLSELGIKKIGKDELSTESRKNEWQTAFDTLRLRQVELESKSVERSG